MHLPFNIFSYPFANKKIPLEIKQFTFPIIMIKFIYILQIIVPVHCDKFLHSVTAKSISHAEHNRAFDAFLTCSDLLKHVLELWYGWFLIFIKNYFSFVIRIYIL